MQGVIYFLSGCQIWMQHYKYIKTSINKNIQINTLVASNYNFFPDCQVVVVHWDVQASLAASGLAVSGSMMILCKLLIWHSLRLPTSFRQVNKRFTGHTSCLLLSIVLHYIHRNEKNILLDLQLTYNIVFSQLILQFLHYQIC